MPLRLRNTNKTVRLFGWALLMGGLASCVRDKLEPCPNLELRLEVEDKNYTNILAAQRMNLEDMRPENLPFKSYVPHLSYQITDMTTGKIAMEQEWHAVKGEDTCLNLSLPSDLPFGTYVLTARGSQQENISPTNGFEQLNLHPEGMEGDDDYFVRDTLHYDYLHYQFTCGLKRLKGKLIINVKNMPNDFRFSTKSVSDIFTQHLATLGYAEPATLTFRTQWKQGVSIVTKTQLAPSVAEKATALDLRFYERAEDESTDRWLAPEQVSITMHPNELTVMRYEYDPCCCRFKIYILVNDNWESLHSMEIESIK